MAAGTYWSTAVEKAGLNGLREGDRMTFDVVHAGGLFGRNIC
jgi:cold shock CspA family protein